MIEDRIKLSDADAESDAKLQRVVSENGDNYSPATCNDIIYYRAEEGEALEDIIKVMKKAILEPLMSTSADRSFTVTDFDVSTQTLVELGENEWLLPYLEGTYKYEGIDFVSMETRLQQETTDEAGRVPFFMQGSEEALEFLLIKEGNVYRFQREETMEK